MKQCLWFILLFATCIRGQSELSFPEDEVDDTVHDLAVANNKFAVKLYSALSKSANNLFFSPLTLTTALSMLWLGARNETAKEISQVLEHESVGLKAGEITSSFQRLQNSLQNERSYTLDYSNTALIQENYKVLDDYKENLNKYFGSSIQSVDFAKNGKQVMEGINKWVAEATKDKIPQFLTKPLDPLTRFFLMSAVYFKGTWRTIFDKSKTKIGPFYNDGVEKVFADMMTMSTVRYPFVRIPEMGGVSALEISYKMDEASMIILLPEERTGIKALEESLNMDVINKIIGSLRLTLVHLKVPVFHIEGEYDLPKILFGLGMKAAFGRDTADLSGITGDKDLHVEEVMHKAVIDVNEEGTEAAAVGGIFTETRIRGPRRWTRFVADHPFLFLIRDIRTDCILFMGRVNKL